MNGDNLEVSGRAYVIFTSTSLCVVQKFPMTIPEMAQASPLQSSDGTVYIGKGHCQMYTCIVTSGIPKLGLSLLCSKIYLLFLPEFPKNFTHYS